MSARYYGTTHRHPFQWEDVASAIFLRYPNPFATHVLTEDTLFRETRGDILYSRRFLTKTNRLPKWGEKFFVNFKKYVPLVEESYIDRGSQCVTTYTRSIGLSRFMTATEKVRYTPDPEHPNETIAMKEIWIESGLYGLRTAVKNFGMERVKKNWTNASKGFDHVLHHFQTLKHQGRVQSYLKEVHQRKWNQIKEKQESLRGKIGGAAAINQSE